ncbi:MAG: LLM class flavin-dependent oxidoreductase [Sphaerobacter sp.]|nr:LLM class flavin-dependent oxidoreductase [Sphaerobacter sp.]
MARTRWGFGIAAAVPVGVTRATARATEALGYDSFWVNDTPDGDGLAALAEAAQVTTTLALGVGVIALSRRDPASIIAQIYGQDPASGRASGGGTPTSPILPLDRLLLGVGSGTGGPGALARVRDGVRALKEALAVQVYISALGPNMCELAGEVADGVLFNWLTPDYARQSAEWVRASAARAGRPTPTLAAYVRVALGDDATARLRSEGDRYARIPAYSAHFARMGVEPFMTAVAGTSADAIREGLAAWDGVLDLVVVRAITAQDTVEETLTLAQAVAPQP